MVTDLIRAALRDNPDGLTATALARLLEKDENNVRRYIRKMPDAYIDRWEGPHRGQYTAVWCVVIPPDNCPHPSGEVVALHKSRWRTSPTDTHEAND